MDSLNTENKEDNIGTIVKTTWLIAAAIIASLFISLIW